MARIRPRNSFISRLFIFFLIVLIIGGVLFYSYKVLTNNINIRVYDLGKKEDINAFEDTILSDYQSYLEFINNYDVPEDLEEKFFENGSYIATFQEYDTCGEKKYKTVKKVNVNSANVSIDFLVHNQCGWCEKHLTLYLIKAKNVTPNSEILANYSFANDVNNCGVISKN